MTKRIIISGISDSRNNGCWAMAMAAMTGFREKYPDVTFIYLTTSGTNDAERFPFKNMVFLLTPWTSIHIPKVRLLYSYLCLVLLVFNTFLISRFKINLFYRKFCNELMNADFLIDLGGDSISTDYPDYGVMLHMLPSFLLLNLRKPYYFLAQSIGPLANGHLYSLVKYILKKATRITVREEISQELLSTTGIKDNVVLTADLAFLLEPAEGKDFELLKSRLGLRSDKDYFGISVSDLIFRYAKMKTDQARELYINQMAKLCDFIVNKYNYDIIFVPHVMIPGNDDRIISKEVHKKMLNPDRAIVIGNELNASEFKGIIGCCKAFLGSRMHATIGAISQNIPTIVVAYNHKSYGIFNKMLGLNNYIVNIQDLMDKHQSQLLYEKVHSLMNNSRLVIKIEDLMLKARFEAKKNFLLQ